MRIERVKSKRPPLTNNETVDLERVKEITNKYIDKSGTIIPLLQEIQSIYGYLPESALEYSSQKLGIELSDLFGVATFYAQFRLEPVGKHVIKVCHGTACHVQDAKKLTNALMLHLGVKDGETTEDRIFTLESVACLGCCSLAPVMMIGNETYGKLTGDKAVKIVRNIKRMES
ncbi:MAG: NADH-quinone oxidoreductase subunit NuoE [Candidatus Cloacimonadota bacterium]|nr:MAG: NADH-quinone oxidoreductase subunit NuoE [Candidatus Cloacimonadota bacterium]PIE78864.1 MAG: NADH-quinone oxidoreductase subunit NuoE [Candidatus Delongbacteria bacterium]